MTTHDFEFRLDMLRYLIRDLMQDLRSGELSPVVDAAHLVALDELRTARQGIDTVFNLLREIQDEEVQP